MPQPAELNRYRINIPPYSPEAAPFGTPDADTGAWIAALYQKYRGELVALARALQHKYREMTAAGYDASFGDIEGEMLYMLVRESQPELVYEISPNAGFSSNYLLAAITRNGTGRVEGFELLDQLRGSPTPEVIRRNLIDVCDPERYHLTLGDARLTTLRRLREESPDFTLIDSCHDDFFAEFYVKALLPRCRGLVFIQDICHSDPRPEHSGEAYYLLSYFQETGTRFLPVGLYDDVVAHIRTEAAFAPRRPIRSNSVVVRLDPRLQAFAPTGSILEELVEMESGLRARGAHPRLFRTYPLNASRVFPDSLPAVSAAPLSAPEDRYVAVLCDVAARRRTLSLIELLILSRSGLSQAREADLAADFAEYDPWGRLLILEALKASRRFASVRALLDRIDPDVIHGAEIPLRLADLAVAAGQEDAALVWLDRCMRAGMDPTLATGYRSLLGAATTLFRLGHAAKARTIFREAIGHVSRRRDDVRAKASWEIFRFTLRHPYFLPLTFDGRLERRQWLRVAQQELRDLGSRFGQRRRGIPRWAPHDASDKQVRRPWG